jgi:hypothetical protein
MFQQQRSIQLPLIGAILLGLCIGTYLVLWKLFAKSKSPAPVIKHPVEKPAGDALNYWTPERMRQARPAEMPHIDARKQGKQHSSRESRPPKA